MKIGIRKFFRSNWKKCMCGIIMCMGVLALSFSALKPKAMELSSENYLSDGEQDFTTYTQLFKLDEFYDARCNVGITDNGDGYLDEWFIFDLSQYTSGTHVLAKIELNSIFVSNVYYYAECYYVDIDNGDYENTTYFSIKGGTTYYIVLEIDNYKHSPEQTFNYKIYNFWLCTISELSTLRTQNSQLQSQITNLQNQNTNLQNQINDKNGYIAQLEDQVGDYIREVERLQDDLANQESNLQTENIQLRDTITELQASIQSLNTQIQVAQDNGYALGYQAGFDAGNNSDNSLYNMVLAVVDAPISIFRSIFDFDILGVNISNLVFGLLSLLLILAIIKLLLFK